MTRQTLVAVVLVAVVFNSSSAAAQMVSLTDEQIEVAIAAGAKQKGREQGLDLQDSAASFMAAMSNTGGRQGFTVVMYTPTTWLRQQASNAAKQYRTFARADVTEEMLEPVLRVIVEADKPTHVSGRVAASSVEHAVLRDKKRTTAIQPTYKEAYDDGVANAMGGKIDLESMQFKFPLEGLQEIRGAKGDQEFFLTVVGERSAEKNFEIKKKHFERIP